MVFFSLIHAYVCTHKTYYRSLYILITRVYNKYYSLRSYSSVTQDSTRYPLPAVTRLITARVSRRYKHSVLIRYTAVLKQYFSKSNRTGQEASRFSKQKKRMSSECVTSRVRFFFFFKSKYSWFFIFLFYFYSSEPNSKHKRSRTRTRYEVLIIIFSFLSRAVIIIIRFINRRFTDRV